MSAFWKTTQKQNQKQKKAPIVKECLKYILKCDARNVLKNVLNPFTKSIYSSMTALNKEPFTSCFDKWSGK